MEQTWQKSSRLPDDVVRDKVPICTESSPRESMRRRREENMEKRPRS